RVADLLGPGIQLVVALVAGAAGQRQYQYRTAGQCGRELLVHRIGPFHGSRPRNIHAGRVTAACRTTTMTPFVMNCTRREKAHGEGVKTRGGRARGPHAPPAPPLCPASRGPPRTPPKIRPPRHPPAPPPIPHR